MDQPLNLKMSGRSVRLAGTEIAHRVSSMQINFDGPVCWLTVTARVDLAEELSIPVDRVIQALPGNHALASMTVDDWTELCMSAGIGQNPGDKIVQHLRAIGVLE